MRILCIPDGLPIDYTIQLANGLVRKDETPILLLDSEEYKINADYIDKSVEVCLINKFKNFKFFFYNLKIFYDNICRIRKINPDIIHIQGGNLLLVIIIPFLKKKALITTFHDVKPHPGHDDTITRFVRFYLKKKSKNIFVHGKKLKNMIHDELDVPKNKVHSIPLGEHNLRPFKDYIDETVEENDSILFFGWIGYRKGLIYLIQSEPMITEQFPNVKIVIAGQIGTGTLNKNYFDLCMEKIQNNETFDVHPYHVSWKEGAELFQKASMVVLPYVETSQSGVIPTAYGFKKPVIVTDVGAMPEIVDEGKTGLIVPPKDPESLAKAIIKLLKNNELRKQMGENAHTKLKKDLSWDKICKKTIKIYKKSLI